MSLLRTVRTVRHLRPAQVVNRIVRRFRSATAAARRAGGGYSLVAREGVSPLMSRASKLSPHGFRFLNDARPFHGDDRWAPVGASRLWTYQLHYFQTLTELEPRRARELIDDWLQHNPVGSSPGWEPYPSSLRVREWIEWLHRVRPEDASGLVESIAAQTAVLDAFLEHHIGGNHLLENAITLCWVGASLRGPECGGWLRRGTTLLRSLLAEQVLDDGVHDERSPMYQGLIAEALLRLAEVLRRTDHAELADLVQPAADRLVDSLGDLTHPDGRVALLNDCAFEEGPTWGELCASPLSRNATAVPEAGAWRRSDAGYVGWRWPDDSYLVLDTGPLGPDHQPGHGHADMLSFELSHRGVRLITDTGTHTYDPGAIRAYDRSTAAHSTIEIDGRDQSELWAAFRCARRARLTAARPGEEVGGSRKVAAAYVDPWRMSHRRTLSVAAARGAVEIHGIDTVRGAGSHEACLRFHLGPEVEARRDGSAYTLECEGRALARLAADTFRLGVDASPYHPAFGVEEERRALVARLPFHDQLDLSWSLTLL